MLRNKIQQLSTRSHMNAFKEQDILQHTPYIPIIFTRSSYMTLIGVHEMHGRVHPN